MKISNNPPQHLSNLEVLNHFIQLHGETDHLQSLQRAHQLRSDAAARIRYPLKEDRDKEFEQPPEEIGGEEDAERRGIAGDLKWVQDQVLKYLCSDHMVTSRQTEDGVATLADQLQDHGLTKGEVLQIVNLAPIEQVELYCIIEDPDTRFHPDTPERLDQISQQIQGTLLPEPPVHLTPFMPQTTTNGHGHTAAEMEEDFDQEAFERMQAEMMDQEFVHEAEYGAAHEEGVGEEKENPLE